MTLVIWGRYCGRILSSGLETTTRMPGITAKMPFSQSLSPYHQCPGPGPGAGPTDLGVGGTSYNSKTVMIVGLGNHGMEKTRHSVGMRCVMRLADILDVRLEREKKVQGFLASRTYSIEGSTTHILLLKPKAFMNVLGSSVAKAAREYNPDQIYLVHDDLDKQVGKFALKEGGSARGHNGVKSVHQSMRTDVFPRLRIGIDRPASKAEVCDYVLENFSREEDKQIEETLRKATWALLKHIEQQVLEGGGLVGQISREKKS